MTNGTIIAHGGLNLRRSPKTGSVIKTLRRSSKVEILEQETWLKVRARDGSEGYVLADFVETAPEDLFPSAPVEAAAGREAEAGAELEEAAASDVCDIRLYRNSRFIGNELRADFDFFPCLDRLNEFAVDCGLEIFVTSSTREPDRAVRGAIVTPATRSNHLVGHAIDMNLKSESGFFNSKKLRRGNLSKLPDEVRRFIQMVRDDVQLRWGGDFSREDPVHIDDALNRIDEARWDSKLASRE